MWLNLIPEHDVLGTVPGAASERGVQDPSAGEAPRAQGAPGHSCWRAQGPSSSLGVLAVVGSLLMTTRTQEPGDNLTAEVPPAGLILPREFCVQNSLNPDSGSASLTCPRCAPAPSPSAGSHLKGEEPRAPRHTALARTTSPR